MQPEGSLPVHKTSLLVPIPGKSSFVVIDFKISVNLRRGPLLRSSGQSSWLQILRSRV
jgi:hypothetical protein